MALIYRGAFDSSTLSVLEIKVDTLISINEEEARRFGCNAIVLGKNVIINEGCSKTRDQLESRGFPSSKSRSANLYRSVGAQNVWSSQTEASAHDTVRRKLYLVRKPDYASDRFLTDRYVIQIVCCCD